MEIVIVTYRPDITKVYQLINDIQAVEYLRNFKIHLIVNDDVETYKICQEKFLKFNTVQIYYFESLKHSKFFDYQNGWHHQQVLKLTISEFVNADWYLVLDSDFRIDRLKTDKDLDHDFFFTDSKANASLIQLSQLKYPFNKYFCNAFQIFNIEINADSIILKENPPVIFRTQCVKHLLKEIDFDQWLMADQTCEFYLYWAYIKANHHDVELYNLTNSWQIVY
jgi:hypothetical protein